MGGSRGRWARSALQKLDFGGFFSFPETRFSKVVFTIHRGGPPTFSSGIGKAKGNAYSEILDPQPICGVLVSPGTEELGFSKTIF